MTRNVKIDAEDIESWGGQIVVTDTVEPDGKMRFGHVVFDNVEIYNCFSVLLTIEGNCGLILMWELFSTNVKFTSSDENMFGFHVSCNVRCECKITVDSNELIDRSI